MPDAPLSPDLSALPEAETAPKSRWRPQLVWLVPLVAALIGGWLAVKSVLDEEKPKAKARRITLELASETLPEGWGDERKLRQEEFKKRYGN